MRRLLGYDDRSAGPARAPSARGRDTLAGLARLSGLAVLPLVATLGVVPAGTAAGAAGAAERTVRLSADDGGEVEAAEVVVGRGRTTLRTTSYSMVAATWRSGTPRVAVRTAPGRPWQELEPLDDGPSAGDEGSAVQGSEPLWVGPDRDLDVRVRGSRRDVEMVLIDPGRLPGDRPGRRSATASSAATDDSDVTGSGTVTTAVHRTGPAAVTATASRPTSAPRPHLYWRQEWGADPSWRNGTVRYTDRLKQVHVHHTAGSNDYTRAEVPGILRAIYRYHTHNLGWFDIGYNFLVDRFGRAWIGRSGGAPKLVRGAHTRGFNHASTGIALIGSYEDRTPSRRARTKLVRLAAWKLDRNGRDAEGRIGITSQGSDRFPAGRRVRLPKVDGHRDTNQTACPGQRLYDRLPGLRNRIQGRIDHFS